MTLAGLVEQVFLVAVGAAAFVSFYGFALHRNSWRWRQLAQTYAAPEDTRPDRQRWTNVVLDGLMFGWNNYAGIALVGINDRGLFLRLLPPFSLLHSPLFFPFEDVTYSPMRCFLQDAYALSFGRSPGVRVVINPTIYRWMESHREALRARSATSPVPL